MIIKYSGKFVVVAKDGTELGRFSTKAEAMQRLREIEYYKHLKDKDK